MRRFLTAKIHRATVTAKSVDYEGSLGLDEDLMDAAALTAGEMVMVFNITNGQRFETYLIPAPRGSKTVSLNGAAARLGEVGDRIIVLAFGLAETPPRPKIITLDEHNNVISANE